MNLITALFSWPFLIGLITGFAGRHLVVLGRANWLDRHRPLEDGRRHPRPILNTTWISGLFAAVVVIWSIYQIEATAHRTDKVVDQTNAFSEQVKACQKEFNKAIQIRSQIQTENDDLAARDRAALRDWLKTLLQPPPDLAKLAPEDPVRRAWAVGVTEQYQKWVSTIEERRQELATDRKNNPLPEPTCGK